MGSDDDRWAKVGRRFPYMVAEFNLCAMPLAVDVTSLDATFSLSGRAALMSQNTELQRNYELMRRPARRIQ